MSASLLTNPRDIDISLDDDDNFAPRPDERRDDEEQDENKPPASTPAKKVKKVSNATLAQLAAKHTVSTKQKTHAAPTVGPKAPHPADEEAERLHKAAVSSAGVEIGNRLFTFAAYHGKKREELSKKVAEQREEKAIAGCSFKPSLSSGTLEVLKTAPQYKPPCERFDAMEQRKARSRLEKAHAEHLRQTKECTFKPAVTPASAALAIRARSSSGARNRSVAERLHYESELRKMRRQVLDDHVHDAEQEEVIGGFEMPVQQCLDAADRLLRWKQLRDRNLELLQEEQLRQQTLREDTEAKADIQAVLYRLTSNYNKKGDEDATVLSPPDPHEDGQTLKVSAKSAILAKQLRELRFRALFSKFARAGETTVSLASIERQDDEGVLRALLPRPPGSRNAVDCEEFVRCLVAFERKFGPQGWGRTAQQTSTEHKAEEQRFHPSISKASRELASKRRPRTVSADGKAVQIHDVLAAQARLRDERLDAARREAYERVRDKCSFQPHINAAPPSSHRRSLTTTPTRSSSGSRIAQVAPATPPQPVPSRRSPSRDIVEEINSRLLAVTAPSPFRASAVSPASSARTPLRSKQVTPDVSQRSSATKRPATPGHLASYVRTPPPKMHVDPAAAEEFAAIYRNVTASRGGLARNSKGKKSKPFR
jgi:hypothetical protein